LVRDLIFVTGCGLYCKENAFDDTWYNGKQRVWCHCGNPETEHCENRLFNNGHFIHCELTELSDIYDYELSIEKIYDERDREKISAENEFKSKYPHLKSCRMWDYNFKYKKIQANAYGISSCMNCVKCGFLEETDDKLYYVCTDITVTERFNCGDLFGEQEIITKHERYKLELKQRQNNVFNSYNQCLRYIKNEKYLYSDIENIIVKGMRWGTLLNCFLIPFKENYFKSIGWISGEITVEHAEPYLVAKTERKTPQMALIAKAEKEAKKQHRLEIYRKRIRFLLSTQPRTASSGSVTARRCIQCAVCRTCHPKLYCVFSMCRRTSRQSGTPAKNQCRKLLIFRIFPIMKLKSASRLK
jgi:hypothetical protein